MLNSLSLRLRRILPLRTIVRVLAARAGAAAARLRPIQERVYIAANRDGELRGNLAEIHRALQSHAPALRILVDVQATLERRWIPLISLVAAVFRIALCSYRVASSRLVIVDDYFFPIYPVKKRPGVTIVQVWHACGAFKRFGRATLEAEWGADQTFLEWVPIHSNYDLTLVSSASIAPIYAEAFGQPVETISAAFGIPRTDALLPSPRRDAEERAVRERLGLRDGRTTILYAPTFRGADLKGAAAPELLDIAALYRALGSEYRLILRLHPFVKSAMRIPPEVGDFVVDASAEPDVNEVMLAGDILVSDYSSIIFEYALLNRPMAFLAPDLAAYERERGFFFDYRTGVPGPVMEETEQLARWIQAKQFDLQRVRAFAAASFDVMDGRATERFVSGVALPALRGEPIRIPPTATRQ
jgi:teichoic acid ribitol-phosphate primase|uniref:CDP-glycerol glycerophosphotransferase family protein n=1 Tax=Candidatus Limnocylindrus sp. TaxID=2802978 RepID=UPI00404931B8